MEQDAAKRKPYGGPSIFGVPWNRIDVEYASECLYQTYTNGGKTHAEAMSALL